MFLGMGPCLSCFLLLILLLLHGSSCSSAQPVSTPKPKLEPKNTVSAIYGFGDSISDPGNNNDLLITPWKCNFAPYGRDFPNHVATGRFCNGRLINDFIAEYVGLKQFVPPYLDKSLSSKELLSGVSFASSGTGYDPLTAGISGVIPMGKQLEYFKEYISRIEPLIGKEKVNEHINKAFFTVIAGSNDFVLNYFAVPFRRTMYTVPEYEQFVVQNVEQFLKELWDLGARKIAVTGLPPIGCLPAVITLLSNSSISQRSCIDSLSSVARDYNKLLSNHLVALQHTIGDHDTKFVYLDIYTPLAEMVQDIPNSKYSFEEVSRGCCGTGYLEISYICNPASYVCPDASKYVYWDSIHPSEMTYYLIFKILRPYIDFTIA